MTLANDLANQYGKYKICVRNVFYNTKIRIISAYKEATKKQTIKLNFKLLKMVQTK